MEHVRESNINGVQEALTLPPYLRDVVQYRKQLSSVDRIYWTVEAYVAP